MASFGKEFVGRQVLDSSGDCLGTLEDLVIDLKKRISHRFIGNFGKRY